MKLELATRLYLTWSDEVDDARLTELSRQEAALKLQAWAKKVLKGSGNAFVDAILDKQERKQRRKRKQTIFQEVTDRFNARPNQIDETRLLRRSLMDDEEIDRHDGDVELCGRVLGDVMARYGLMMEGDGADHVFRLGRLIMGTLGRGGG